jgi:hypothetical protein
MTQNMLKGYGDYSAWDGMVLRNPDLVDPIRDCNQQNALRTEIIKGPRIMLFK